MIVVVSKCLLRVHRRCLRSLTACCNACCAVGRSVGSGCKRALMNPLAIRKKKFSQGSYHKNTTLTFGRDILPVPIMELNLRCSRLFNKELDVLRSKWGVPAEKDVGDDTVAIIYLLLETR